MKQISAAWLRLLVLLLAGWSLFGVAVATMIVYGVFDNVAMSPAVMATAIATGVGIIVTLVGIAILGIVRRINHNLGLGGAK